MNTQNPSTGEAAGCDDAEMNGERNPLDGLHFGISRDEMRYSCRRRRETNAELPDYERWRLHMLDFAGVEINLDGYTFEAITMEAQRIKLGEEFTNFDEFDFALDCWEFLHIRATHRAKHRKECRVRVCQYGATMFSRKPYSIDFSLPGVGSNVDGTGSRSIVTQPPRTFSQFSTGWRGRASARNAAAVGNTGEDRDRVSETHVSEIRHRWENGRCGERLRYLSAGRIKFLSGNAEPREGPVVDPCKWRVRAHMKKGTEKVTIRKCDLQHSCPSHLGYWRCTLADAKFLATILCHRVRINPRIRVQDLVDELRTTYSKRCSYHQVWRGREVAKDWLLGAQSLSFNYIPALLNRIQEMDSRALVDWSSWPHNPQVFRRAFICPGATREILPFCQPVVAIDACHSKNRKFPTQIFLATALDGGNQSIILAFAVAPVENEENWTWFLENLKTAMGGICTSRTVFMSDRQKGLLPAVANVFPGIINGYCAQHIESNVRSRFGKRAERFFRNALYADSEERYNQVLAALEEEGDWQKEVAVYIKSIQPSAFCRFAFPLPRAGKVTSNVVESANAAILKLRHNAPFKILYDLWFHIMQRFSRRRKLLGRDRELLTQHARARYVENEARAGRYVVFESSETEASVQMNGGRQNFIVKHGPGIKSTCSCWEYQEMNWPCAHVIAWDHEMGKNLVSRFDSVWHNTTLQRVYEFNHLPSFTLDGLIPIYQSSAPPIAIRQGRHRVVRVPSGGGQNLVRNNTELVANMDTSLEFSIPVDDDSPNIFSREQTNHQAANTDRPRVTVRTQRGKCSLCKEAGHNRRTCPTNAAARTSVQQAPAEDPAHNDLGQYSNDDFTVRLTEPMEEDTDASNEDGEDQPEHDNADHFFSQMMMAGGLNARS